MIDVPDGYYAVRYNGKVGFYRFHTSKPPSRWAGRQWVDRYASDEGHGVSRVEQESVRQAVAADPARAARAFATEIGRCCVCGRTLTDATSRSRGIGPDCLENGGFLAAMFLVPRAVDVDVPDAERVEPSGEGQDVRHPAPRPGGVGHGAEGTPTGKAFPPPDPHQSARVEPPAVEVEEDRGSLSVDGRRVVLRAPYDPARVARVRAIPTRRWVPSEKVDRFELNPVTAPMLAELARDFGLRIDGDLGVEALAEQAERNAETSRATDADVDVAGLGGELLPFQRAGVRYAIDNRNVLIGDEMGLGKTVQALATLEALDAFPALVIVPAVVKLNWRRETRKWLPDRTVAVVDGRWRESRAVPDADVVVVNYDLVGSWRSAFAEHGFAALVADESHYLKNPKAQRTKAVRDLARKIDLRLLLTGTPVLNRPVELVGQLDVLGHLSTFGGFMTFAKRYCGAYHNGYGWDFSGASNLDELHDRLRRLCYVRRTKEQVLSELPAKRRVTVPLELADRAHYAAVESDLRVWLRDRLSAAGLEGDELDAEIAERERRSAQAETLVRIEACKRTAVDEKLAAAEDWIENFLNVNGKLVVFAHHVDVVERIAARFPGRAVSITGSTSVDARQRAVDAFQNDDRVRLLVGNISAAGVGITLTAASDVAFVELPWRPGDLDQAEDRCHRIGQQDSVTAWYLLAAETIEEEIASLIDEKRGVVEAATDGREVASTSIMAGLLAALGKADG